MTRHADIDAALDGIVSGLSDIMPEGTSVQAVGGAVSGEDLQLWIKQAPAVLVACLGMDTLRRPGSGGWSLDAQLIAYVVVRAGTSRDRAHLVHVLVSAVVRAIGERLWGNSDGYGVPSDIRAANLSGGGLDTVAAALWSVSWRQEFRLVADDDY